MQNNDLRNSSKIIMVSFSAEAKEQTHIKNGKLH